MEDLLNGLLTKGLGVDLPACKTLITMQFNLFTLDVSVPLGSAGYGGSPPLAPGEIHDFYKPIDPETFPDPLDPSFFTNPIVTGEPRTVKEIVTIKMKIGDRIIEKEFAVPKKRIKIIVKVANIINSTRDKFNIVISNIKRVKNNITTRIFNFRSRNKDK